MENQDQSINRTSAYYFGVTYTGKNQVLRDLQGSLEMIRLLRTLHAQPSRLLIIIIISSTGPPFIF